MQEIKIYTITSCPYCIELKELLSANDLTYIEINVDQPEHESEYDLIHRATKSDRVPIVRLGKHLLVPDVSFKSISECMVIIDKILNS